MKSTLGWTQRLLPRGETTQVLGDHLPICSWAPPPHPVSPLGLDGCCFWKRTGVGERGLTGRGRVRSCSPAPHGEVAGIECESAEVDNTTGPPEAQQCWGVPRWPSELSGAQHERAVLAEASRPRTLRKDRGPNLAVTSRARSRRLTRCPGALCWTGTGFLSLLE